MSRETEYEGVSAYEPSDAVKTIHQEFARKTTAAAAVQHQIKLIEHYKPRMNAQTRQRANRTLAYLQDVLEGKQKYGAPK